eukprot:10372363-Ditylum_brightwellii.AAC.1
MMDDKEWQSLQLSPFPSKCSMRVCNNFLWWLSGIQRLLSCLVYANNAPLEEEPVMHALICSIVYGDTVEMPPSSLPPCDLPSTWACYKRNPSFFVV